MTGHTHGSHWGGDSYWRRRYHAPGVPVYHEMELLETFRPIQYTISIGLPNGTGGMKFMKLTPWQVGRNITIRRMSDVAAETWGSCNQCRIVAWVRNPRGVELNIYMLQKGCDYLQWKRRKLEGDVAKVKRDRAPSLEVIEEKTECGHYKPHGSFYNEVAARVLE